MARIRRRSRKCAEDLLEEVIELGDAARGPFEAALGVAQVAHDVAVLPAAALRSRSAQIAGRR